MPVAVDSLREFRLQPGGGSDSNRLTRARSVDVLSTATKKNETMDNLSRLKDFDLKKNIDARLERLTQSLGGPPSTSTSDEAYKRKLRRSRLLSTEPEPRPAEQWQSGAGGWRDRGHSVPPPVSNVVKDQKLQTAYSRHVEAPYAIEKLSKSSVDVERHGNILLRGSSGNLALSSYKPDVKGREVYVPRYKSHIHELLETLRANNSVHGELASIRGRGQDDFAGGRQSVWAEVDSFASLINKLRLPATLDDVRRHGGSSGDQDDFWTRLDRSRGDLNRLETLVGNTFRWGVVGRQAARTEPTSGSSEIQIRKTPGDIVQFIAHSPGEVDRGTQTSLSAQQAIRWAQERRQRVEMELERERRREQRYKSPKRLGSTDDWNVEIQPAPVDYSSYFADDEDQMISYEVPTIVRPSSAFNRRQTSAIVDNENVISNTKSSTKSSRAYTRSASDSVVANVGRSAGGFAAELQATRRTAAGAASKAEVSAPPSEVRRRVREVLDKYRQ
jgi:hypothetical protein